MLRANDPQVVEAMLDRYKGMVSDDFLRLFIHGPLPKASNLQVTPNEWIGPDGFEEIEHDGHTYEIPRAEGLNLEVTKDNIPVGVVALIYNEEVSNAPIVALNIQSIKEKGSSRSIDSSEWAAPLLMEVLERAEGGGRSVVIPSAYINPYTRKDVWREHAIQPETLLSHYDTLAIQVAKLANLPLILIVGGTSDASVITDTVKLEQISSILHRMQRPQINSKKKRALQGNLLELTEGKPLQGWVITPRN